MTYFDHQEWVPYSFGTLEERMPGMKSHSHEGAHSERGDGYVRYWCDECDAFAWRPR